jgi:branched-chain amino acid transport system ATP-binding protein
VAEAVLRIENLAKNFGGLRVTDDVTLDVMPGELHAVIGPNGAGKTTLINQISGLLAPDAGRIVFGGEDVTALSVDRRAQRGLARSFQITSILPRFSVLENVALAVQARSGSSFRFFRSAAAEDALNEAARAALAQVGLAEREHVPAGELSHGEKRALELAIALGDGAEAAPARRADGGHRARRDRAAGHGVALPERPLSDGAGRARHACRVRARRPHFGPDLWRILASGTPAQVRADPQVVTAYLGEEME